jgi:pre-mRNA-processing factor 19
MEAPLYPGSRFLSLDRSRDLALLGGFGGVAEVVSISQKKVVQTIKVGSGTVTDGLWAGDLVVLAMSTGAVKVFEDDSEVANFTGHAGEATSVALHPSGEILASVGVDKSYIFYDLMSSTVATHIYTNSRKRSVILAVVKG